jgi:hypothetical protein
LVQEWKAGSLGRRDALVILNAQRGINDALKIFIGPPHLQGTGVERELSETQRYGK